MAGEEGVMGDNLRDFEMDPGSAAELAKLIYERLNPRDGDESFEYLIIEAVEGAISYAERQACSCLPGDEADPCDRCYVLGRWHDKAVER